VLVIALIILSLTEFFIGYGYKALWRETGQRWRKTQAELAEAKEFIRCTENKEAFDEWCKYNK